MLSFFRDSARRGYLIVSPIGSAVLLCCGFCAGGIAMLFGRPWEYCLSQALGIALIAALFDYAWKLPVRWMMVRSARRRHTKNP